MSDLSSMLAEAYGTHQTAPAPSDEDMQKQASINLFAKLASDNGVDLTKLSDEQVNELYADFCTKLAEEESKEEKKEPPPAAKKEEAKEEKKDEEKEAAAREEFRLQKEAEAKVAEADYLGRVMAHAYVNELKKIAGKMPEALAAHAREAGKAVTKGVEHAGDKLKNLGKSMKSHKTEIAAGAGGAAAGAAAGEAHGRSKKASALDLQAAEYAVKLAHDSGLDAEAVGEHLDARLLLGVTESTKTAGVEDFNTALHIRALELLEQIGVPVTWKESELREWGLTTMRKHAEAPAAVGSLPSASPVPEVQVLSQFAPGKKGPTGTAPKTNYSRVNSGAPELPDAGAVEQKSLQPKYGSHMHTAATPNLQDLVHASIAGVMSRTKIAEEAKRQADHSEPEKCSKCGKDKEKCSCGGGGKMASAGVSTEHATKLAGALDYLADVFAKSATENQPGTGPGALQVTEATASTSLPDHKGQATPKNVVPMNPGEEKVRPTEQSATALATNDKDPPGAGGKTPEKVAADLTAANLEKVKAAEKLAADDLYRRNLARFGIKVAEDAINPAHISAGPAQPPQASAAGQPGGEPAGGAPKGPTSALASNESAINLTRGEAYQGRKEDMKKWLTEPMDSSKHDNTLQVAFDETSKADPKIGSAQSVKTAAARAIIEKMAEKVS